MRERVAALHQKFERSRSGIGQPWLPAPYGVYPTSDGYITIAMNDLNVLVDPADEAVVVGVIDFGDLVHTALVADVAIVAADLVVSGAPVRDAIADVVMAYHEITPLQPMELVLLNPLIAGRILTDVVVASWHRKRNPAGTHYSDLDPTVVRARVQLATELLATDMPL